MPQAPKARDNLVGDVEDVVCSTDLERAGVVAVGRNNDATTGKNRLGDKRTDVVGTNLGNEVFQVGDLRVAPLRDRHRVGAKQRADIRKKPHELVCGVHERSVAFLARHRCCQVGRAVVCLLTRDGDLLVRSAQQVVVELHKPQGTVDGRRPAGGEEHPVQIAWRHLDQALCQLRTGARREVPRAVERQLDCLVGHCLCDLGVAVANLHVPHSTGAVDVALAVGVVEIDALGLCRDQPIGRASTHGFPRVHIEGVVPITDVLS